MNTFKSKLLSGVPYEATEMGGKQQRILTESNGKTHQEKLNEMLASCLVRVGDVDIQSLKDEEQIIFVKAMLTEDRRFALCEIREFSLYDEETKPEDKVFRFNYPFVNEAGEKDNAEQEVSTADGFPARPYKLQVDTYSQFVKDVELVLPRSKEKCKYTMMDGLAEERGGAIKKKERSSHSPLIIRNPRIAHKETFIQANLDKMGLVDIEALRTSIKENEGKVDTELMFEHPEAEKKGPNEKNVVIDVLSIPAFFFPSQAI